MNNINFTFDDHYLVAEIENAQSIINYQMEMLTHTEIKYILPVKRQVKNNRTYLFYDIKGLMALDRLITHKKMPDTSYVDFVKGTLKAINELEEYQLSAEGLVMNHSYIFVHPIEYIPHFVYIPVSGMEGGKDKVLMYLKNMLTSDLVDISSGSIMQHSISILNSGGSVREMLDAFEHIGGGPARGSSLNRSAIPQPQPAPMPMPAPQPAPAPRYEPEYKDAPAESASVQQQKSKNSIPTPHGGRSIDIPGGGNSVPAASKNKKENRSKKETSEDMQGKPNMKKIMPVLIGASAAVILIFAAAASTGIFNDENGNMDYASLICVPIFMVAVDYFVYSKLKTKYVVGEESALEVPEKKEKRKKSKEVVAPVSEISGRRAEPIPMPAPQPAPTPQPVPVPQPVPTPEQMSYRPQRENIGIKPFNDGYMDQDSFADSGKTEIISGDEFSSAYLQSRRGDRIIITEPITRIGKLKEQVDVVIHNPKVSRVHADIILRNGKLYVMDLGSANGTYINGNHQRITGNTEYELNNNDRVVFANEEYTVHC